MANQTRERPGKQMTGNQTLTVWGKPIVNGSDVPKDRWGFEYIAQNGMEMFAIPVPLVYKRRFKKETSEEAYRCTRIATLLTWSYPELLYAEGFARNPAWPDHVPPHAWNVTPDGQVIDLSWENPQDCKYFGYTVPTVERAKSFDRLWTFYWEALAELMIDEVSA
jgi:hypothetical protein